MDEEGKGKVSTSMYLLENMWMAGATIVVQLAYHNPKVQIVYTLFIMRDYRPA